MRDQHTAGSKRQFRSSNYHGMTFHPTDCQMLSLNISHMLQFHISNCCCSGVHEMHLGILLRRSETDCLAIAAPSLAFKAMSPQCLLNLFSVTSGSGSLSSTYSPSSAFVINLFSLPVNGHTSLVSDHHFSSSSYPSTPVGLFAVFSRTGAVGCRPCPVSEVPPR